jgi:hypothetical protein
MRSTLKLVSCTEQFEFYMKSKKAAYAKGDTTKVSEHQLVRAFKRALKGAQAVSETVPLLEQELMRYAKLQEEIKVEFGGKLFLADGPPTSVENIRRFRAYFRMRRSATTIIIKLIHEVMRAHGVCPDHPRLMCELQRFDGRIGAAGAPTGVPPQQKPGGQPYSLRAHRKGRNEMSHVST